MNLEQIRNISIYDYMVSCGYKPRGHGKVVSFHSPFGNDVNPSFKVNTHKNRFSDFHAKLEGSIIDLVQHMENISFTEACRFLENGESIEYHVPPKDTSKPGVEILQVQELRDQGLIDYFTKERNVSEEVLLKYCKQVDFRFPYGKAPDKVYMAAGFQNDMKGWELRSSWQKIASAPKSFTTIKGTEGGNVVNITEGFLDALSLLSRSGKTSFKYDTYVLNGCGQLNVLKPFLEGKHVMYYGDNDAAGDEVLKELDNVIDMRHTYEWWGDANEMLMNL